MKFKKVGLALGGGAAKGFAHVGVLKVLEENNIPIDMVSGTSMGGLIGAMHCSGLKAEEIENLINKITWRKLIDPSIPRRGLIKGDAIKNKIGENIKQYFSELSKPLFITATDLLNQKEIIFNKGNLPKAVRATISLPGIFNPVEHNNTLLVDGGVSDILPIEILRKQGAELIIAVNVLNTRKNHQTEIQKSIETNNKMPKSNIYSILSSTFEMMASDLTLLSIEKANPNILISPDLREINYQDFHKHKKAIDIGDHETKKAISEIKKSIKKEGFLRKVFLTKN